MIVDANDLEPAGTALDEAAVCVIGAGPAGLTVARRLAAAGRNVVLLEAGGFAFSEESQDVYRGDSVGDGYFDLDACRLRYYGGSSNHWGGWSRPLDDHDFEVRSHVPFSGWPITKRDIAPYQDAAAEILTLENFPPNLPFAGADGDLERATWRFSEDKRFPRSYRREVKISPRLRLVVHANLVDFEADPVNGVIRHAMFRHYGPESPLFRVSAPLFVLACGGIENPRILLNANRQFVAGLGNHYDQVGRNFIEHPHFDIGQYVDLDNGFDDRWNFVVTTRHFVERMRILGCAVVLHRYPDQKTPNAFSEHFVRELCELAPDFAARVLATIGRGCTMGRIRVMAEQAPNLDSRVSLSRRVDAFGQRRVRLEWRKTAIDRRTVVRTAHRVGEAFAAADTGRLKMAEWVLNPESGMPVHKTMGGNHHMGTTRMGTTPRSGVVDADCRLFGHPNLYVAGSSVFPTGGYANPTLTIVQLALRLADHLLALS